MDELEALCAAVEKARAPLSTDLPYEENGISLLALKNDTMLAYIHHLVLLILSKLELGTGASPDVYEELTKACISDRVVLERGVGSLESKLSYQIQQVLNAHKNAETQASISAEKRIDEEIDANNEVDSDDDETAFRPNLNGIAASHAEPAKHERPEAQVYKPPKISATSLDKKPRRAPRSALMEEFLNEMSDRPMDAPSVGTEILEKGVIQTAMDRKKEKERTKYEEENFTRLMPDKKTKSKRKLRDNFFGEDWGFTNSPDRGSDRKKSRKESAYKRSKRRARGYND
ncbi:hypothetical protein CANCADRAFT_42265 [Tortispora caseinolytica NRRL Y-17796]|uniref:Uncharacterized protein n=1 Tax=Tortispora caseinolytica NRRL Y-17796 TaxID=767744 RepID=A0A1E4TIS0_9ASCO|nr:hypothetical protein CANCADRAFT_42265 [Tortispora caseinolytica NRRL Y-17796]